MTQHQTLPKHGSSDLNHLTRGVTYRVTTRDGSTATGEYLGIETPYGSRAILLRHRFGTHSIAVDELVTVLAA